MLRDSYNGPQTVAQLVRDMGGMSGSAWVRVSSVQQVQQEENNLIQWI